MTWMVITTRTTIQERDDCKGAKGMGIMISVGTETRTRTETWTSLMNGTEKQNGIQV